MHPRKSQIRGRQKFTEWNAIENEEKRTELVSIISTKVKSVLWFIITRYFLPSGDLSPDYYTYAKWRMLQRFVASTSSVFGTQSLLLALGFSKSSVGKLQIIYIYIDQVGSS